MELAARIVACMQDENLNIWLRERPKMRELMDNQLGVLHTRRLRHYWSIIDNIYDTRVRDREDRRKGDPTRDTMHLLTTDIENHLHLSKRERRQVRSACTELRGG